MPTVMKAICGALGEYRPFDGQYLKAFDFEAHDGQGLIDMTPNIDEAMKFETFTDAFNFARTSPKCKPIRPDGKPNRPLTATTWEFAPIQEGKTYGK